MASSSDDDFDLSTSRGSIKLSASLASRKWKSDDEDDDLDFDVSDQEEASLELAKACEDGDVAEVKRILADSQDVNVNFKDEMDLTPLIYATQRGLAEVVQLLLLKGANVNLKGDEGKTALFHACRRGKTAIVGILLANGAQANAADEEMKTPLFYAAMQGRSEILEQLLAHGADITRKDEDGRTALFYALECDHVHLANALLAKAKEAGADLLSGSDYGDNELLLKCMTSDDANAVDDWGKTALIYACKRDCVETVKYLVRDKSANVNYKTTKTGATALLIACKNEKSQIAELLIEHGADVNASNDQRRTALWYAIEGGMSDVCRLLIAKGADVSHVDGEGRPLLWKAFAKDDITTAQLLLAKGAAVRLPSADYGDEALLFASLQGGSVDTADEQGMTPLLYACKNGQMRLAKYLLKERRPSAKAKNVHGWTGLHFLAISSASSAQQSGVGASSIGQQGARGKTGATSNREKKAKERMSSQDRLEVAELLLANGCDVNAKADVVGVSAFYAACMAGDRELVRLCIDHGAEVNATGEGEDRPAEVNATGEGDDDLGLDDMNVEEWTDDEGGAWDEEQSNVMDEDEDEDEDRVKPQGSVRRSQDRTSPLSESHFKGREDLAARPAGKRSRSKSYRERVNIFQRDREEEAIGESGEEEINLNKGPLLVNIIRRQNRKNGASGDMEKNYLDVIKILLDHGAAVDVKDDAEGRTPLLWACLLRNKDTGMKIVQLLLERGADLNQRDNGGNSALLLATAVGNKMIVKHLLRDPASPAKGAARVDVNQKNGKGYTALVTAIQDNYKVRAMADLRGNVAVAKLLIKWGADVNLDGGGHKPLYFACSAANLEMVKLLVENGADVNHRETYSTPLITAILKGNPQVVKYLVRKGADVEMKIGGKDSFYFAAMRGLRDITRILRQGPGSGAAHRTRSRSDLDDDALEGWEEADEADDDEEWEKESRGNDMSLFKQRMGAVVLQDDDEW